MAGHSSSARGFGFFDVMVDLTKDGFENVDQIIKIIFQVKKSNRNRLTSNYLLPNFQHTQTVYKHAERGRTEKMDFRRIL